METLIAVAEARFPALLTVMVKFRPDFIWLSYPAVRSLAARLRPSSQVGGEGRTGRRKSILAGKMIATIDENFKAKYFLFRCV